MLLRGSQADCIHEPPHALIAHTSENLFQFALHLAPHEIPQRSGALAVCFALRRAICTDILHFPARVLVIQAEKGGYGSAMLIPDSVLPVYSGDRAIRFSRAVSSRRTGARVPMRSALGDQAAASIEGHVPQAAERFGLHAGPACGGRP
jgi:hypothetical protein